MSEVQILSMEYSGTHDCCGTVELSICPRIMEDLLLAHVSGGGENELISILLTEVSSCPKVKKVIYHAPATIVYWNDGTKTVVKCGDRDTYSKEAGLALCHMKKMLGSSRAFNDVLKEWVE